MDAKDRTIYHLIWERDHKPAGVVTWDHYLLAATDASLGVGHCWTEVPCPAYRTLDPKDCTCS